MGPGAEEADVILSPHTQEVEADTPTCFGGGQERQLTAPKSSSPSGGKRMGVRRAPARRPSAFRCCRLPSYRSPTNTSQTLQTTAARQPLTFPRTIPGFHSQEEATEKSYNFSTFSRTSTEISTEILSHSAAFLPTAQHCPTPGCSPAPPRAEGWLWPVCSHCPPQALLSVSTSWPVEGGQSGVRSHQQEGTFPQEDP